MEKSPAANEADTAAARTAAPLSAAGATPMMEQFIEIKSANADSLLFYRMGDFYELFFEDAEIASRTLGITLTKRGKHQGEDIPMCGVPVHAADDYLQKLIAAGHRVAVCEQIEDPAEARKRGGKSVVRRDVVRLVTPGTITEEKLLAPGEANYLMALARIGGADGDLAMAWVDISTGAFRVAMTTPDRLAADLMRVDPREIVLPEALWQDEEVRRALSHMACPAVTQPAGPFDSGAAAGRIARYYGLATIDGFGAFERAELSAIAGAIAYVERTQKDGRAPLSRPQRESAASSVFIDPATRTSLELLRSANGSREGSLFRAIDRTLTGAGARLLAERLTAPLTDPDAIRGRLDAVGFLRAEPRLRADLREALKRTPDMPRALSRLALGRGGPRDLAAIRDGATAAADLAGLLARGENLPAELARAAEALEAVPPALCGQLAAALADELPLLKRDGGFVRAGYDGELDEMRRLRDETRRIIAGMERALAEETGIRALKIRHNNVLGYYIEVSAGQAGALTGTDEARARFIHRQTMASAMRFTTTELSDLESRIANAAGRAVAIELSTFDGLLGACVAEAEAIRRAADAIAGIDVAAGFAALADADDYCRPEIDDSLAFQIEGGRHPVVEQALRRQLADPFVANDCDLSPPDGARQGAIWLLTGPNMGGKSTFLRQNALIAILAQAGAHVPARRARIGVVDRLFSRVGASDDLARGRSTFMVEMVETAAILNQAGERSLVILDEIGRGTATFDGLSIAWATVEHLHETNRCRAIFATHFHELTALGEKLPRLANVTMRVKEWNGEVVFLHEVGRGAADRSYGVQVARLAGLPAAVVARAKEVLDRLEQGELTGNHADLLDDLPLFGAARRETPAATAQPATNALADALGALRPDEMTPRQALEALYELRRLAGS